MLRITDLKGVTDALTGYKRLKHVAKVNGEETLSFEVVPTDQNKHSWPMVDAETKIEFNNQDYYIKELAERNKGKQYTKEVTAVHSFYWRMIDCVQYKQHTGSMTFFNAMQFVFEETPYSFQVVGSFTAREFENLGGENCLALFVKLLDRYKAEFELRGNIVYLHNRIGTELDVMFRYSQQIKTIEKHVSTRNLSTVMRGYGGEQREDGTYPVERVKFAPQEYLDLYGVRHGTPVFDQRYTTNQGMDERLENDLIYEPEVSITIDIVELRAAGYNQARPRAGDVVWLFYEPMGIMVRVRIVEIETEYEFIDNAFVPKKTAVTLSNIQDKATDMMTRFENTNKTVRDLMAGKGKLPWNVLDEAVLAATRALQSAQTQLIFENGIIARDKNNPQNIVLFNSAGIGISQNGGATFDDALVAGGLVAEAVMAGAITQGGPRSVVLADGYVYTLDGEDLTTALGQYGMEFFSYEGEVVGTLYPSRSINNPSVKGISVSMVDSAYYSIDYQYENNRYASFQMNKQQGYTLTAGPARSQSQGAQLVMLANAAMAGNDLGAGGWGNRTTDQAAIVMTQNNNRNDVELFYGGYSNRNNARFQLKHNINDNQSNIMMEATASGVRFPSFKTVFGTRGAGVEPFPNGIALSINNSNYIFLHDSGQVEFWAGGRVVHAFATDGTKQGGTIEIDGERLGMSPVDSPQFLIEYLITDVQPGKRVYIDERFLKAVDGKFAVFTANGASVKKADKSFVVDGEEVTDVRIVGERYDQRGRFWQTQDEWRDPNTVLRPASFDTAEGIESSIQIHTEEGSYYEQPSGEAARARAKGVSAYVRKARGA